MPKSSTNPEDVVSVTAAGMAAIRGAHPLAAVIAAERFDLIKVVVPELVGLCEYSPDIDAETAGWIATSAWDIVDAVLAEGRKRGAL